MHYMSRDDLLDLMYGPSRVGHSRTPEARAANRRRSADKRTQRRRSGIAHADLTSLMGAEEVFEPTLDAHGRWEGQHLI